MATVKARRVTDNGLDRDVDEFRDTISLFNYRIDTDSTSGRNALHKDAEVMCMHLLNALYGWKLVDANPPAESEKAIDLIDRARRMVVQVTSNCTSRKINDKTIAKMNEALEGNEEVPYRQKPGGEPYRLKFVFVGYENKTKRSGARRKWKLTEPKGFVFDREADTIFTSDLTHAFKNLSPDRRTEVLELARSDYGPFDSRSAVNSNDEIIMTINARLKAERKHHPSFLLLDNKPSWKLLPKGTLPTDEKRGRSGGLIPNARRLVRPMGEHVTSFGEFMRESWAKKEQSHLYITGKGGIGKTVAMLTFATEDGFLPRGVAAVYVQLYRLAGYAARGSGCIDAYLRETFVKQEVYECIVALSDGPWEGGPKIILLLDGHNELPSNRRLRLCVEGDVAEWAKKPGVQIVATSRASGLRRLKMHQLELKELDPDVVRSYLADSELNVPDDGSSLWDVIRTPLMLKLYTDVKSFSDQYSDTTWLTLRESNNAGNLIWNYLHTELYGCCVCHANDGICETDYIYALMLVLPYICWKMMQRNVFDIDDEELMRYLEDGCGFWSGRRRPRHVELMELKLGKEDYRKPHNIPIEKQLPIFEKETAFFLRKNERFVLMHQGFRDHLAAMHLNNEMLAGGESNE